MSTIAPILSETKADPFVLSYETLEKSVDASSPPWVRALRHSGNAHFEEVGFPDTSHEEWRFTNVGPISRLNAHAPRAEDLIAATPESISPYLFKSLASTTLVFVNGVLDLALSCLTGLTKGVEVVDLPTAIRQELPWVAAHLGRYARVDENAFVALNGSMIENGVAIRIPANVKVEAPVFILFLSTSQADGATVHSRILIVAGHHSEARVVESHAGLADSAYFSNSVAELVLEEGAKLEHCRLQFERTTAFHVATVQAHQARSSNLTTHSISLGARLARINVTPVLDAEGCECTMNGLYVAEGDQLVDHHTTIHHAKPNCNSHEFYHGILDGKAQGVFNGKIFVRPDAQRTDAKQTNRNLLLSDEATINTKPQLEIFADDVKCTHGATVGQLQDEAIFYLRARGIGLEAARRMLVHAFASSILNRITIDEVRTYLDDQMFDLFERPPA